MNLFFQILFYIGWVFVFSGLAFFLLSAVGILRMPDTFTRLHAGTKASTLGSALSLIGVGFIYPEWFLKTFILAVFILITNPISSSVLARASYKNGVKFINKRGVDMYKEVSEKQDAEITDSNQTQEEA